MRIWHSRMAAAAVSMLALAAGAQAQAPATPAGGAPPQSGQGVQAFEPAFFARYNPVTAEDMVRQLPGFEIDEGEELRGFGATAGNVLIDGQRPSSKTSIRDELGRIAARDVLRVELIRASAAGDIDVRGYTELANVVLKPSAGMTQSTTWNATTRYYEKGRQGFQAGGTRAWKTDDFGARLNVQGTSLGERENVEAAFYNAAGAPTRFQDEFYQQSFSELIVSGAANWTPTARDTMNLNFRVQPRAYSIDAAAKVRLASGTPIGVIAVNYTEKDLLQADLGGDWEHKFSAGNAVKLVLVNRVLNWRPQQTLTQALNPLIAPQGQAIDNSDNRAGEHVLRGVWTLKPGASHTVEFGLEGAYNYRDVERQSLIGPIGGPYSPVLLPVSSTKVEEDRIEASITDVWRINPKLTLETGFNFEASTISQSGDAVMEGDFTYPKPRLVATWTPNPKDQYRLSLVRDVSQLDFGDFATGFPNLNSGANVGNPLLEPEQTWKASAQWKRPIGQRGSISITGFYDQIEDTQDFFSGPFAPGVTAVGNVGDGERWGGRIEAAVQLDSMGIANGLLKFNAGAQDSKVTDPLTGVERQIGGETEYDWSIDFRQDIPSLKIAWGGDYASMGPNPLYRVDRLETSDPGEGDLDLFIETTRFLGGALVRLGADNLFDQEKDVERQFFTPNRIPPGVFSGSELRASTTGRTVTLTIAGAF